MDKSIIENDEEEVKEVPLKADPDQRLELPFFKDPKIKISLWTILKESIGKDISRITVPVFFNQPLNILQTAAQTTEYLDQIMLKALAEKDPVKRLAYVSVFRCVYMTNVERGVVKPFNPLLNETYELCLPGKFKFIAEKVSHHPPICAYDV